MKEEKAHFRLMCVDGSQTRHCLTDKQGDGDDIYRLFNEAEYDMKIYTARRTRRVLL